LSKDLTHKQRREIKAKMAEALKENIKGLSTDFQKILIDDLVTAFQNRINVLMRVQTKSGS
jgi:Zn/Cd-binding protein ZinT